MIAYHNDPSIKEKYLARVREHSRLDHLAKGTYYQDDGEGNIKVCAVGCTIHGDNHKAYETELGIPEWLARLEDRLFENMSDERSMLWPEQFLSTINPGSDLEKIKGPFLIFVLESVLEKFDHQKFPDVKKVVDDVIALWKRPDSTPEEFAAAAAAAADAAWAAWAARAAARAADAEYEKIADKLLELMRECK